MTTSANYASVPKVGIAAISTANTNRDGTGTVGTVFSAGGSGSRIDSVSVKALGVTTNGMIRLYIHDGTTSHLIAEIEVLGCTPSGTVKSFEDGIQLNIVLQTGYSLRASTHNAESFKVFAHGGDF